MLILSDTTNSIRQLSFSQYLPNHILTIDIQTEEDAKLFLENLTKQTKINEQIKKAIKKLNFTKLPLIQISKDTRLALVDKKTGQNLAEQIRQLDITTFPIDWQPTINEKLLQDSRKLVFSNLKKQLPDIEQG